MCGRRFSFSRGVMRDDARLFNFNFTHHAMAMMAGPSFEQMGRLK
jgi:hypothetical protein